MRIIDDEQIRQASIEHIGGVPPEEDVLVEMIRCELWAQNTVPSKTLCRQVANLSHPISVIMPDSIRELLEEMERAGDVITGPRGMVASAPIRIVPNGEGRYRLFGTLPDRLLKNRVESILKIGTTRELYCNAKERIDDLLNQYGGILLDPDRWAGLDRDPQASAEWIEQLDASFDYTDIYGPGNLDEEVNETWFEYKQIKSKGKKTNYWKKSDSADSGKLWRGWSLHGWPIYLWTLGGCPSSVKSIRLNQDEAARAVFSLARVIGPPVVFFKESLSSHVALYYDTFLPFAEYRYLMTMGEHIKLADKQRVFNIPADTWPIVEKKLRERLGVEFETKGN